ncbi:MAG: hypothetical protein MUC90_07095, partial [Thermoplasmata archaeon]|nr:hypothetical protein [Thermoplasmata archaeon]
ARPITAATPIEGLDQLDRIRRHFARRWAECHPGQVYPDGGGRDRAAARELLAQWGTVSEQREDAPSWETWAADAITAYLGLRDRWITEQGHPLALVGGARLTAISAAMGRAEEVWK